MAIDILRRVLSQAWELREKVREDIRLERWGTDDIQMGHYNELIGTAAGVSDDSVLRGTIQMPDATLQSFHDPFIQLTATGKMPNYLPCTRLEARLSSFIDRLELVLGEPARPEQTSQRAKEVLDSESAPEVRTILDAIDSLRDEQQDRSKLDTRDFGGIEDEKLRRVLAMDYVEAQLAFRAGAFKACAILSAGLIEGMLLDRLTRRSVAEHSGYEKAVADFPRAAGEINWDRVSLSHMISAAGHLGILDDKTLRMAEGANDFRDTTHPRAEVRGGVRAQHEEAKLFLALAELVYRNLGVERAAQAAGSS